MINSVVIVGRLVRDPELRRTTSGLAVASFTIAVDNRTRGPNNERTTSFIPCVVYGVVGENTVKYTHKGSLVGITGRINQRSYDAKDGRKVQVIEVICDSVKFLESKGQKDERGFEPVVEENVEDIYYIFFFFELSEDDVPV